jgi:hypothetical protein
VSFASSVVVPLAALCLVAPGAAPPAEEPSQPAEGASAPRDWSVAPPGSPEDVALWSALRDVQNAAVLHMARISHASYRIRYGRYYELLDEKGSGGSPSQAEAARRTRSRIEAAAKAADEAIPKQGLRVRTCKYTLLHLDQRMSFPDDPTFAAEMPATRSEARDCVAVLTPFAARIAPLADALESALDDGDALLDRTRPVPPSQAPAARDPGSRQAAP